jgi:cytochrome c553
MRSVARALSDEQIASLAAYYASPMSLRRQ